jgi:hypothetical protein
MMGRTREGFSDRTGPFTSIEAIRDSIQSNSSDPQLWFQTDESRGFRAWLRAPKSKAALPGGKKSRAQRAATSWLLLAIREVESGYLLPGEIQKTGFTRTIADTARGDYQS